MLDPLVMAMEARKPAAPEQGPMPIPRVIELTRNEFPGGSVGDQVSLSVAGTVKSVRGDGAATVEITSVSSEEPSHQTNLPMVRTEQIHVP